MDAISYDVVSFDLDGTLVDTAGEIAEAANRTLETHGFARRPVAEISLLIGGGTAELMRRLLEQVLREDGEPGQLVSLDAVLASLEHHYNATAGQSARPYPGCIAALVALRDAGIHLACVTNKEARYAQRVLEATGLAGYFELLIGGDTLPEKKPQASVLQHVAAHFGSSTDRLAHVGDSRIDVEAARNAGVAAWVVPYGYNAGQPIADARPERIFPDLAAAAAHVLAQRAEAAG
jgi:phosphoglycolate phosphatase